jgi:hypothetical protein
MRFEGGSRQVVLEDGREQLHLVEVYHGPGVWLSLRHRAGAA